MSCFEVLRDSLHVGEESCGGTEPPGKKTVMTARRRRPQLAVAAELLHDNPTDGIELNIAENAPL
eukprot:SAG11_NODE_28664_length_319_cov_0.709091_1_plen_64_part_01